MDRYIYLGGTGVKQELLAKSVCSIATGIKTILSSKQQISGRGTIDGLETSNTTTGYVYAIICFNIFMIILRSSERILTRSASVVVVAVLANTKEHQNW